MKSKKSRKGWYEPGVYYYEIKDDGLAGLDIFFAFLVVLVGLTIVFVGFFALILLTFDYLLFGDFIPLYIELLFGFLIFGIICFASAGISLNPIHWYIHCRNIEVECRDLEAEEVKEMIEWIDENMKILHVHQRYSKIYKFARKSDAMAFKLRWG